MATIVCMMDRGGVEILFWDNLDGWPLLQIFQLLVFLYVEGSFHWGRLRHFCNLFYLRWRIMHHALMDIIGSSSMGLAHLNIFVRE